MRQRLSLIFSATALVVALLGSTPLGRAAGGVLAKGVPFAENAGKLNGHVASTNPKAGQIPVLNPKGTLPASIGAVGAAGPQGAAGPKGDAGSPGLTGYQQVAEQVAVPANSKGTTFNVPCPGGKTILSGGYNISAGNTDTQVYVSQPTSNTMWQFQVRNPTGGARTMTMYLVCANVGS